MFKFKKLLFLFGNFLLKKKKFKKEKSNSAAIETLKSNF